MRHIAILLLLGWLAHAVTSFRPSEGEASGFAAIALSFGALMLAALFSGRLAAKVRLPKIVAYILAGVAVGPSGLGLIPEATVGRLGLVNGVAVCLIALTAGGELNLRRMRPLLGVIARISGIAVLGTCGLLIACLIVASSFLPFLQGYEGAALVLVAASIGITLTAQSPAVVMAMISETRADGPVSRVILGTVVIADLMIIVLFGVASSVLQLETGGGGDAGAASLSIAWELFGSMAVGVAVGGVLALHQRFVKRDAALFVLLTCAVVSEVGRRVHLDPLIVMLAAGMVLENLTKAGASALLHELEPAGLPVFLVFFALAGASLHVDALTTLGIPALIVALVRASGFWAGANLATRGAEEPVRRYAFAGLLPQAGLALALAILLRRILPHEGEAAATFVFAVIAINELTMPLVLRHALLAAGEGGKRPEAGHDAEHAPKPSAPPADPALAMADGPPVAPDA
ncbi:MAG: cation:proton antiporter [Sandaracinaceae bacterium]